MVVSKAFWCSRRVKGVAEELIGRFVCLVPVSLAAKGQVRQNFQTSSLQVFLGPPQKKAGGPMARRDGPLSNLCCSGLQQ